MCTGRVGSTRETFLTAYNWVATFYTYFKLEWAILETGRTILSMWLFVSWVRIFVCHSHKKILTNSMGVYIITLLKCSQWHFSVSDAIETKLVSRLSSISPLKWDEFLLLQYGKIEGKHIQTAGNRMRETFVKGNPYVNKSCMLIRTPQTQFTNNILLKSFFLQSY